MVVAGFIGVAGSWARAGRAIGRRILVVGGLWPGLLRPTLFVGIPIFVVVVAAAPSVVGVGVVLCGDVGVRIQTKLLRVIGRGAWLAPTASRAWRVILAGTSPAARGNRMGTIPDGWRIISCMDARVANLLRRWGGGRDVEFLERGPEIGHVLSHGVAFKLPGIVKSLDLSVVFLLVV